MPNPKYISDVLGYLKNIDDLECEIKELDKKIDFQYENMGMINKSNEIARNRKSERLAELRDHMLVYPEEDILAAMKQFKPKKKKTC